MAGQGSSDGAGQGGSDGAWKRKPGACSSPFQASWMEGREEWLNPLPREEGAMEWQVECKWCMKRFNSRLQTIVVHETSDGHQKQQQQRQQKQQQVAKLRQQLGQMGDLAARRRAARMQDHGLHTQFATVYQHLRRGRPITDVPDFRHLLQFVRAPNVPDMHWKSNAGGRSRLRARALACACAHRHRMPHCLCLLSVGQPI